MDDIDKMELIIELSKLRKIINKREHTIDEIDEFELGILELYANIFNKGD